MAVALVAATLLVVRHALLPQADRFRDDIAASLSSATGLRVALGPVTARWSGLRPSLRVDGLRVSDRHGREALAFQSAELSLAWWTLLAGDLRLHDVDLRGPALQVRRAADGVLFVAGLPLRAPGSDDDGALARWLLAQPHLSVRDATLSWEDESRAAPPLALRDVQIAIGKSGGRHRIALRAAPPPSLAAPVDLRADLLLDHRDGRWDATGTAYAHTPRADLSALRSHLPVPDALDQGIGAIRLWVDLERGVLREVVADVNARGLQARLAADTPVLALAEVVGRVGWRRDEDGAAVSVRQLAMRTTEGLDTRVASASLSWRGPAGESRRSEVRADGLDVAAVARLLPWLPVAPEMRSQLAKLAPRGTVHEARLLWEGDSPHQARVWQVAARVEQLGIAAVAGYPGFSGLTGSVSGDASGGRITVGATDFAFDATRLFAAPLRAARLDARAGWVRGERGLEVVIDEARISAPELEATVAGRWRALPNSPEQSPGWVDLTGRVERARAAAAARFLPNTLATARRWLDSAILGGELRDGRFALTGDLWHFPFQDASRGRFTAEAAIANARLRYDPAWPAVERIAGRIRFENASLAIDAKEAQIYASRSRSARAFIGNLGADPPELQLDVAIDTVGGDGARFLRETPLVAGPGAFTRVIGVTGPARVQLRLDYPLWGPEPARVKGEYVFAGAQATIGRSLVMQGIRGSLAFTERSVRAPSLTGSLLGQPAQLRLGMQGPGEVLGELEGRLGADVMGVFLPEAVARRTAGSTAWRANIVSGSLGTELRIHSTLEGLAVGLPEPFGKTSSSSRPLAVTIRRLGEADEETVATLAGGVHARIHRSARPGGDDRWQAAVRFGGPLGTEPRRDGLWLYGRLDQLDLDAWRAAFAAAAAGTPGEPAPLELEGLALTVNRLVYTGRELAGLDVQLRRDGPRWSGTLDGPPLSGDVSFDFTSGRGEVRARLKHFVLQAATAGESGPEPAVTPASVPPPALDIVADRFEFRGRRLGRLDLQARHDGPDWRIERLEITDEYGRFSSSGVTTRGPQGVRTRLQLALEARDLSKLLARFGYGAHVSRGEGSLRGTLDWPGDAYDFSTAALSGQLRAEAARGQFARIEAGAGKLLGLLSLQSLPRRITLDFRDVFSDGFAFDRAAGDVSINRGVLRTEGFEIAGPSAFVTMAGEVSLPLESQSLTVRVVPEVGESVAVAATVLGTPVMGLTTLLLQKLLQNPFGKVIAYEYRVTGSWDNPAVARQGASSAPEEPRPPAHPASP